MQVLGKRGQIIEWAGRVRAYPVLKAGDPLAVGFSHPGDAEAGAQRVGWKDFFAALEKHGLLVVAEDPNGPAYRVLAKATARAELPPAAFGPPWYAKVWHEVMLTRGPAKSALASPAAG